jgi:hypothetical protein
MNRENEHETKEVSSYLEIGIAITTLSKASVSSSGTFNRL